MPVIELYDLTIVDGFDDVVCAETCSRLPIPVDIVRKPAVVAAVVDNDGSLTSESGLVVTARRLGYLGVSLREPPPPVIVLIAVVDVIVVVVVVVVVVIIVVVDAVAPVAVVDVVVIVDDRAREEASAAWSASPSML